MSRFDDDIARGCLSNGEPLEALYGVGWWTEENEPDPDPADMCIELEARIAELETERDQAWSIIRELIKLGQDMRFRLAVYDDIDPTLAEWSDFLFKLKNDGA
jgi:hypothetical protein